MQVYGYSRDSLRLSCWPSQKCFQLRSRGLVSHDLVLDDPCCVLDSEVRNLPLLIALGGHRRRPDIKRAVRVFLGLNCSRGNMASRTAFARQLTHSLPVRRLWGILGWMVGRQNSRGKWTTRRWWPVSDAGVGLNCMEKVIAEGRASAGAPQHRAPRVAPGSKARMSEKARERQPDNGNVNGTG